jgi:hypothetical protein
MDSGFDVRIQIIAVVITVMIFLLILELVRRRRLVERYALLWMIAAAGLVVLAVWRDLLNITADALGIAYDPNALFLIAFGVIFVLLLHFSVATSRLSEETKVLAQEVARLDAELRAARAAARNGGPDQPVPAGGGEDKTRRAEPSSARTSDQ